MFASLHHPLHSTTFFTVAILSMHIPAAFIQVLHREAHQNARLANPASPQSAELPRQGRENGMDTLGVH
jgi:hypothetical protein